MCFRDDQATLVPVFHIARLRIDIDGKGVTSLVGISGCPNRCKFCINFPRLKQEPHYLTPQQIYDLVCIDELYFKATGGGVTFGGGEPLLFAEGIVAFSKIVNGEWKINVETSLNIPIEKLKSVIDAVDSFVVDIKDWNEEIYYNYTRISGEKARTNLKYLLQQVSDKVIVRVPEIPGYNTKSDIQSTIKAVRALGAKTIDQFTYRLKEAKWD